MVSNNFSNFPDILIKVFYHKNILFLGGCCLFLLHCSIALHLLHSLTKLKFSFLLCPYLFKLLFNYLKLVNFYLLIFLRTKKEGNVPIAQETAGVLAQTAFIRVV